MSKSRREFLTHTSFSLLGAAIASQADAQQPNEVPPGTPSAFGTSPPFGPEVSADTFAQAEKLVEIELSAAERAQAASNWRNSMAPLYERRTGPRKVAIETGMQPWSRWDPVLPGTQALPPRSEFVRSKSAPKPLPSSDEDIAFAPVSDLSLWVEQKKITSTRLTEIYLRRLEKYDPQLRCVITLTREHALAQAKQADAEIAAGRYRGPLHGIPWGGKDLLDTAGVRTTYGAEPFRDRVPSVDATVVKRLNDAGAVLVAKLSMGALALNDIWFGGQTMNPWLPGDRHDRAPGRAPPPLRAWWDFLSAARLWAASLAPACVAALPVFVQPTDAFPERAR